MHSAGRRGEILEAPGKVMPVEQQLLLNLSHRRHQALLAGQNSSILPAPSAPAQSTHQTRSRTHTEGQELGKHLLSDKNQEKAAKGQKKKKIFILSTFPCPSLSRSLSKPFPPTRTRDSSWTHTRLWVIPAFQHLPGIYQLQLPGSGSEEIPRKSHSPGSFPRGRSEDFLPPRSRVTSGCLCSRVGQARRESGTASTSQNCCWKWG